MGAIKSAFCAVGRAFGFLWKNNRVWLLVTSIALVFVLTVSLIITQVGLISGTFDIMFGGKREYIIEGDPSQFIRFKPDEGLNTKQDALNAANAVNEQINEEGIVLLKNDGSPAALPLASGANVSVFGKNSVNLVYGGSGSGGMAASSLRTIYDSLSAAEINYNTTLKGFYEDNSKSGSGRGANPGMATGANLAGFATGETPRSSYTDVRSSYAEFDDAAIVVFSRIGGEGWDLPRSMKTSYTGSTAVAGANADDHYLQLDNNERDLLVEVSENFDKIIVVINSATSMQLGFLDEASYGIDAALWIGKPGAVGIMALGKVLNGAVNPSGRLVDTYAKDFTQDPVWNNFGNNMTPGGNTYQNISGAAYSIYGGAVPFVEYQEDIYLGYRYYETRGFEERKAVLEGNSSADEATQFAWYDNAVMYPFGYGLSYSEFEWSIASSAPSSGSTLTKNGEITITVNVKNNGPRAGKDVVQLYYSAPYVSGEIEKSHVVLGAFAKTELIAAGDTVQVELKLDVRDMASYDCFDKNANGSKVWELDEGAYTLFVGKNANEAWRCSGLEINYIVPTDGFVYDTDSATNNEVANRFDDVSNHIKDTSRYLSRVSFSNTMTSNPKNDNSRRRVEQSLIDKLHFSSYMGSDDNIDVGKKWEVTTMPTLASREVRPEDAMQLYELVSYDEVTGLPIVSDDEAKWEQLLSQLTFKQMADLVGKGAFTTGAISTIGKRATIDPDGPAGFTNFMGGSAVYDTCFYASECVVAATWNVDLARAMGNAVGNEGLFGDVNGDGRPYSGWYAPAANIHRSPFSGRNWEYYSEDGFLSGMMGANVVAGAKAKGVYTYVKHFALNDQESDRGGIITWASEQAMREIYLRAFELIVKEGGATAMMSSFNRIGTTWAGGSYELLTELLRNEWGFKGMVISDYNTFSNAHMNVDQMVRAGGDLNLFQDQHLTVSSSNVLNASHVAAVKRAAKNILYTTAGSNIMNGVGEGVRYGYAWAYWTIIVLLVNILLPIGFAIWGVFAIRATLNKNKAKQSAE